LLFISLSPTSLTANIRYDKLASAFDGFAGYHAEDKSQINSALNAALNTTNKPSIINIAINPSADRKAQVNKNLVLCQIMVLDFLLFFLSIGISMANKIKDLDE
jgi:thiamine pyrophosphate-dependent acetolactate synthase large subunit-like protein